MPVAPTNSSRVMSDSVPNFAVSTGHGPAALATSRKSSVPNVTKTRKMPSRNPQSPTRLVMNAFLPASDALFFSYQYPISRYEQRPTPSQPTNITRKFAPRTSVSMKKQNRFRYEKYRATPPRGSSSMYDDRVDVDEEADPADDEDHQRRERVDPERPRDVEAADLAAAALAARSPGSSRTAGRSARAPPAAAAGAGRRPPPTARTRAPSSCRPGRPPYAC